MSEGTDYLRDLGINFLREGLDLPEVSLVAILDADKGEFLRGGTSLTQTASRAARQHPAQRQPAGGREPVKPGGPGQARRALTFPKVAG